MGDNTHPLARLARPIVGCGNLLHVAAAQGDEVVLYGAGLQPRALRYYRLWVPREVRDGPDDLRNGCLCPRVH